MSEWNRIVRTVGEPDPGYLAARDPFPGYLAVRDPFPSAEMRYRYPEEWPAFEEAGCERFGHDSFTAATWERCINWLLVNAPKLEPLPPGWCRIDEIAHLKWAQATALLKPPTGTERSEPRRKRRGRPAATESRGPKASSRDDLTPTAWKLLEATRDVGAVDTGKAVGRGAIAAKARVGNHDSKHVQEALKRLTSRGYLDAKRGHGTWITEDGNKALNKRSKSG
jgi:hypothetical protein